MTTIKLAVLKHTKAKDGTYKIRIAIGHKQETHYITTKYRVQSYANFSDGLVVNQPDAKIINAKLRQILNDYDQRLERVINPDLYSCVELRQKLKAMRPLGTDITYKEIAQYVIDEKRKDGHHSTAQMQENYTKKFLDFLGGDILLAEISTATITQYQRWLKKKGYSIAYEGMLMNSVKMMLNVAIRERSVHYEIHPFTYWKEVKSEPREVDISIEDMRKIRDYQTIYKGEQKAHDIFMLSYYLGGINLIDLLGIDFRGRKTLEYIRTKTKNKKSGNHTTSFTIPDEAKLIIERYMNPKSGKLDFHSKAKYHNFLDKVTDDVKRIAKKVGIEDWQKVCYYTARKSFVQHGFDLGISLEVLEYCIGQSMKSGRPIYNYLKIMRRHADVAIRTILNALDEKSGNSHEQPDPITT